MKALSINTYQYCIVNSHDDILALFRFSESAQVACDLFNKQNNSIDFRVRMTANVISGFKEFEYLK